MLYSLYFTHTNSVLKGRVSVMVLFAWVRVSKFFFFFGGGGVTYYNVFAFNKTEFLKGGSLAQ